MHKDDLKQLRFSKNHGLEKLSTSPNALLHLSAKECWGQSAELGDRLNKLQNLMHANTNRGLLVVLQGMDTAGKDGVIRHVFQHVSPLGVRAEAFGAPSELERKHDFLWRVHQKSPSRGEMVIFNRSHYEDVLVTRVRQWIDDETCKTRYAHICHFEELLRSEGIQVVKFFLHISKDEQRQRLQSRLDDPHKRWKLQASDFEDRQHWTEYMHAYQNALTHTDSDACPWYVIPADSKPHRDVLIGQVLVHTLETMKLAPPESTLDFSKVVLV